MKIFVVFGSVSDEKVSLPLVEALEKDFEVEYKVISAHRNLDQLHAKIKTWKGDAIIAGAGLAAALPGVVAAMTPLPVFGVPVPSQFGGLDSLCSIAQMPPGVPVLSCGPGRTDEILAFLRHWKCWQGSRRLHYVVPAGISANDDISKASALAEESGFQTSFSAEKNDAAFNVYFVSKLTDVRKGEFGLHIPFFTKSDIAKAENYMSVLDWTNKGGLWLGANNTRNAVQSLLRLKREV